MRFMSGHSKWSTIKRQKGAADVKRGVTFTKIANAITIAARLGGGGEIESNPRLRMVVDQAREANMPKDNVQRAIDRGLGKLPGQTLEEVLYEGFGPGKVAFLVEGVTDNKNRTYAEVRNTFDRSGGGLGTQGSVSYMFDKIGEIKVSSKNDQDNDDQVLELIDTGAEDVEEFEEDGHSKYLVYTKPQDLNSVAKKIKELKFNIEMEELSYKANVTTLVKDQETLDKVFSFIEKLEDNDDVQKVHPNFDLLDNLT